MFCKNQKIDKTNRSSHNEEIQTKIYNENCGSLEKIAHSQKDVIRTTPKSISKCVWRILQKAS